VPWFTRIKRGSNDLLLVAKIVAVNNQAKEVKQQNKKDMVMKESIISLKLACQQVVSEKNWAVLGRRKQANPVKKQGEVKKCGN
jgi:hypothetical protein